MFTTLVSPSIVADHLDDDRWVVVDCRFDLQNPDAGEQLYRDAHVPGAVYAHLDRDLSGPRTGANGRHPLPSPEALADTLSGWGIEPGVQVVVYDQNTGMFAGRLWWLLRASGHEAVAMLDGGFAGWQAEGRPTRAGVERRTPRPYRGALARERWLSATEVIERLGDSRHVLIDARAPERYQGLTEPIDAAAGHIPGAVNHHYSDNLGPDGRFRSPDELRALFADVVGVATPDRLIAYCGSGVSACHNILALELAGYRGVRLYAGSWSEWSSDPDRPFETGPGAAAGRPVPRQAK